MPVIQRNLQINWENFVDVAKRTTTTYINDWIRNTYIRVGMVEGPMARVPSGGLESRTTIDFAVSLRTALAQIPGVSSYLAEEFSKQVWRTWKQWYQEDDWLIPLAFPMFAAYPSHYAPPTAAPGSPYFLGSSNRLKSLNPLLKQKLLIIAQGLPQTMNAPSYHANPYVDNQKNVAAGGWKGGAEQSLTQFNGGYKTTPTSAPAPELSPVKAMENYANWFDEQLTRWKAGAMIVNLLGEGPVPAFNPLANILFGPVVHGKLRGEKVLTGYLR